MSNLIILGTGRKSFLVCAIAVVAFGILSASNAKAQTTWIVTIDVRKAIETPTYDVSIDSTNNNGDTCSQVNQTQDTTGNVYVCAGDTVLFRTTTARQHGEMTVYQPDAVLSNKNGVPTRWFHAAAAASDGGVTDLINPQVGSHEYIVGVFDPDGSQKHHLYVVDPQIIIGTGNGGQNKSVLLNGITVNAEKLTKLYSDDSAA